MPAPRAAQQIGWVIVGGMALGTLLTLFVVPALYAALPEARPKAVAGKAAGAAGAATERLSG